MGTWGTAPWDNDYAADWLGETLDESGIRDRVIRVLEIGLDEVDAEEIRAAAAILLLLGHVYVWPIETLEADLALGITRLEEILPEFEEDESFTAVIAAEIEVLRARRERMLASREGRDIGKPDVVEWWKFE